MTDYRVIKKLMVLLLQQETYVTWERTEGLFKFIINDIVCPATCRRHAYVLANMNLNGCLLSQVKPKLKRYCLELHTCFQTHEWPDSYGFWLMLYVLFPVTPPSRINFWPSDSDLLPATSGLTLLNKSINHSKEGFQSLKAARKRDNSLAFCRKERIHCEVENSMSSPIKRIHIFSASASDDTLFQLSSTDFESIFFCAFVFF